MDIHNYFVHLFVCFGVSVLKIVNPKSIQLACPSVHTQSTFFLLWWIWESHMYVSILFNQHLRQNVPHELPPALTHDSFVPRLIFTFFAQEKRAWLLTLGTYTSIPIDMPVPCSVTQNWSHPKVVPLGPLLVAKNGPPGHCVTLFWAEVPYWMWHHCACLSPACAGDKA